MPSTTDLETLIRRLAGRDLPAGASDSRAGGRATPAVGPVVTQEVEFLEEIRRRTRVLLAEPADSSSSLAPEAGNPALDPGARTVAPTGGRVRRVTTLVVLGLTLLALLGGTSTWIWSVADRSSASRTRAQTALLTAELRRELAAHEQRVRGNQLAAPNPDRTSDDWKRLEGELAAINTRLASLIDLSAPRPAAAKLASQAPASARSNLSGEAPNPPSSGADLAAIRREINESEAAMTRQIQEMRTVVHELNAVVRRVLSRPTPENNNNVALPLLAVAVQALINNLHHQTTQVRGEAVEQLTRLGALARSALPALQQMQPRESDPNIRSAIETAIRVISSN